jgi:hypothetical protein
MIAFFAVSCEAKWATRTRLTRQITQVLTLDPSNPKGQWGVGRIFLENSQPKEALPFLRRAVELARLSRGEPLGASKSSNKFNDRRTSARQAAQTGRTADKTSDMKPALNEVIGDQTLGIMLLDLGVCLGETAHFSEQIGAFEESYRLRPTDQTFANMQRVRQYMCDWQDWYCVCVCVCVRARAPCARTIVCVS